jgi:acetate kinase
MEKVGKKAKRLVSCHLGAGCSITAIKNGRSIDTSMGFTPLEGIVMMTRSGSIDPGILIYLKNENLNELLNEKSGVYGICGIKDFRDVLKSRDKKAKLAIEIFCYSVSKQIGAYAAVLGGLDGVAFTGGIGENSSIIRNKILEYIKFLKPKVFIIKSDEKEILLKEALKLLKH